MPYVSVIIPAYNSADFIIDAYRSIVDQTLKDWEIIFVNDGSQDDTLSTLRSLAERDERVTVIDFALNLGPACARNAALGVAQGSWIAVLDADDRYSHDRLEVLTRAAEQNSADIALDNQFVIDPISRRTNFLAFEPDRNDIRPLSFVDFLRNNQSNTFFDFGYLQPIIRRSWLVTNNVSYAAQLRHGEDLVFLFECYARGAKVILLSKPYYHYYFQYSHSSGTASPTTRTETHYEPLLTTTETFIQRYHSQLSPSERALVASCCESTREARVVADFKDYLKRFHVAGLVRCLRHPIRLFRGIYYAKRRGYLWSRRIRMFSAN